MPFLNLSMAITFLTGVYSLVKIIAAITIFAWILTLPTAMFLGKGVLGASTFPAFCALFFIVSAIWLFTFVRKRVRIKK